MARRFCLINILHMSGRTEIRHEFIGNNHNVHPQKEICSNFSRSLCSVSGTHSTNDIDKNLKATDSSRCGDSVQRNLLKYSISEFNDHLRKSEIKRCFILGNNKHDIKHEHTIDLVGKLSTSHETLNKLHQQMVDNPLRFGYDDHEAIFLGIGSRTNCLLGAFLWRTLRGQAIGGVRLLEYSTLQDYLTEGLKLSVVGGVKAALSGLWIGGGKGLIAAPKDNTHLRPDFRQKIFWDYGDFISSLNGCFISGLGMCTSVADFDNIATRSKFCVNFNEDMGSSGDPSLFTAKGVIRAMEAAVDFMNWGSLEGKRILVQGAGKAGIEVVGRLLKKDVAHVYVSDCNQKQVDDVKDLYSNEQRRITVEKVPLDDPSFLYKDCDILVPCGMGQIFNEETIPNIQAKIICGPANNQVDNEEHYALLEENGIIFIPEEIANRMNAVRGMLELYGRMPLDPVINQHLSKDWNTSIYQMTQKTLKTAQEKDITPHSAAYKIAFAMSKQLHPIYPGRCQQIIQGLVDSEWHRGKDFWKN